MKKQALAFLSIFLFSVPALASDNLGLPTYEDVVVTVLSSSELKNEKDLNSYLNSLQLKSINLEVENNLMVVSLKYSNGGAPCYVRAEVTGSSSVPSRALGFGTDLTIKSLSSACALY